MKKKVKKRRAKLCKRNGNSKQKKRWAAASIGLVPSFLFFVFTLSQFRDQSFNHAAYSSHKQELSE
jgi:hypothetical protein